MKSAENAAHFRQRVEELKALYPDPRSAIMDALHLAQKRHGGWLPVEALQEVAEAMELTPADVQAVASFYDMYHLAPVGRHSVEVCTNLSCALVGAQAVVDAFEEQLGIPPGETTEDGEVTFRLIECAGGCGYAPVVVVDHRYREPVRPEEVPAIVEGIRGG
jgi:NADH-quinone oxidoreductase subunit E